MKILNNNFKRNVINVPSSKSYINRALIIASITEEPVTIINVSYSQDVLDLINNLKKLGLKIIQKDDQVIIQNSFPSCENENKTSSFNLGEGGTTSRFFMALLSLGRKSYTVDVSPSMRKRPVEPLLDSLKKLEVKIDTTPDIYPISLRGPIRPKDIEIDCGLSTQFFTAIRLITHQLKMNIKPLNLKSSLTYVKMTEEIIQQLNQYNKFEVPVDFSSLANMAALGLVFDGVEISNCFKKDEFQSDSQILNFIEMQNGHYYFSANGLEIKPLAKIIPFEWDCADCLDLVPVLCFMAAKARGKTLLRNVENLIYKESNRLEEIQKILADFGVNSSFDYKKRELQINGTGVIKPLKEYRPVADHRLVMMSALFLIASGGGKIYNTEAVNKSFPGFFEIL